MLDKPLLKALVVLSNIDIVGEREELAPHCGLMQQLQEARLATLRRPRHHHSASSLQARTCIFQTFIFRWLHLQYTSHID